MIRCIELKTKILNKNSGIYILIKQNLICFENSAKGKIVQHCKCTR